MRRGFRRFTTVDDPKVITSVSVGHGVNEFYSIVIPPVIPLLVTDLGITYTQAGILLTVFFAMYSLFQLPAGMISDRIGKERLMIVGLFGMSIGILLAGMAQTFAVLLVAQAIAGVFGSTFHPTGMAVISDTESEATEGRAMGLFGAGGKLGTMGAPLLVGGIASLSTWRTALLVAAAAGFVITALLAFVTTDSSEMVSKTVKDGGALRIHPVRTLRKYGALNTIPRTRSVIVLFAMTVLISIQSRAIQTFTTSYIVDGIEVSVSVGNVAFFALLLGGGVGQIVAGGFADTVDRGLLGAGAALLTATLVGATVFLAALVEALPHLVVLGVSIGWLFLIGALMYATSPVKNALVSSQAGSSYSGGLFGVIQTGSALGSATGPVLFGFIATEWGLAVAYPFIAVISIGLAGLFGVFWWETRR